MSQRHVEPRLSGEPSAFDDLPFPTRAGYRGDPGFLPIVGTAYRFRDWWERRLA